MLADLILSCKDMSLLLFSTIMLVLHQFIFFFLLLLFTLIVIAVVLVTVAITIPLTTSIVTRQR